MPTGSSVRRRDGGAKRLVGRLELARSDQRFTQRLGDFVISAVADIAAASRRAQGPTVVRDGVGRGGSVARARSPAMRA